MSVNVLDFIPEDKREFMHHSARFVRQFDVEEEDEHRLYLHEFLHYSRPSTDAFISYVRAHGAMWAQTVHSGVTTLPQAVTGQATETTAQQEAEVAPSRAVPEMAINHLAVLTTGAAIGGIALGLAGTAALGLMAGCVGAVAGFAFGALGGHLLERRVDRSQPAGSQ